MNTQPLSPKAIVSVKAKGSKYLPVNFPWVNGVSVSLRGDLSSLSNLQSELEEIKRLVLVDINKFDLNLKEFDITVEWPVA